MREEMYVPGQDDFPGWDEFYAARNARVSRWRYSIKTLMILPPLVALICWAYSVGYRNGNSEEQAQFQQVRKESQARQAAELAADLNAKAAAGAKQAAKKADEQNRLAMAALAALLTDLDWQSEIMPDGPEFASAVRATALAGLKKAAADLSIAAAPAGMTPEDAHALIGRHLDLARAFVLLRSTNGALNEGRKEFEAAEEVARGAFTARRNDGIAQQDAILAHTSAGDFNRQWGRAASAADSYQSAFVAAEQAVRSKPNDPKAARGLVAAYSNLADMQFQLGSLESARIGYQAALVVLDDLAKTDERNVELQRDAALLNGKLGDVCLQLEGLAEPRDEPQEEFGIFPERLSIGPSPEGVRLDRYLFYQPMGDAHRHVINLNTMQTAYQTSLSILKVLALEAPQDRRASRDMAHAFVRLANPKMAMEDFAAAKKLLEQGLARLGPAPAGGASGSPPSADLWRADIEEKIAECETAMKGMEDLQFVFHKPAGEVARLLGVRGRLLARAGRATEAMATAERLETIEPASGERLFAAAEIYALAAAGLLKEGERSASTKPPRGAIAMSQAERKDLHERAIAKAVRCLDRAAREGYWDDGRNSDSLTTDSNLTVLFGRDEFDAIVTRMNEQIAARRPKAQK